MAAEFLDSCWENPFVVESKDEAIKLQRVVQGHELWAAIEAAQFACMVVHDEPSSEQEDNAITAFFEAFSQYTEAWEETLPGQQGDGAAKDGGACAGVGRGWLLRSFGVRRAQIGGAWAHVSEGSVGGGQHRPNPRQHNHGHGSQRNDHFDG